MEEEKEKCLKNKVYSAGTNTSFCESVFDGLLCWNVTESGSTAFLPCPGNPQRNASKICDETGKWFVHEILNVEIANYSQCMNEYELRNWLPLIKTVSQVGYWISFVFLTASILIFTNIKNLRGPKNCLHSNLFASFIIRAVTFFLREYILIDGFTLSGNVMFFGGLLAYNEDDYKWIICKVIMTARQYSIVANYMFTLMEGVYLHNLIFLNFFTNSGEVAAYVFMGWGLPAVCILPWTILRIKFEDTLCWTTSLNRFIGNVIDIPIAITVLINLGLFIRIVRILYGKISSMYMQQRSLRYRKMARSTLVLIHLLGAPYAISEIVYYTAERNTLVEIIWIFCDQTYTAYQGLIVALLFCFFNSEVQMELLQKYRIFRSGNIISRRVRTISQTQDTFYLQDDPVHVIRSPAHWQRTSIM